MKLTNTQVLGALQGLNTLTNNKLPIKLAWKVTTAIRELEGFAKALEQPMQEIRTKYALRDDNEEFLPAKNEAGENIPNTIQIPTDKIATVTAELSDLMNEEVEVLNVSLKIEDFPDTLELEPVVLNALIPIIVNE